MNASPSVGTPWQAWCARLLLFVPALLFYSILWKNATSLPIAADDYHAVLEFANTWSQLHGFLPKLLHILTFQQNEYKLLMESTLIAAEYGVLGHIALYPLIALGNVFVLLTFLVLISTFRPVYHSLEQKPWGELLLLAPVSLLLFQLQYATTLDWAMGALQNITVIFFSLWSIHMLSRRGRFSFALACAGMLSAIACSGNGFMIGPTGLLMLVQQRRWRHAVLWTVALISMICLYFFHYNFRSSQAVPGATVGRAFLHFNPLYGLSFMGSSVARYQSYVPSIFFGSALIGFFLYSIKDRYYEKNPSVFYCMVFVVLTALGVSGLRSNFGIAQSLASRYRIYSNLMFIFTYMFLAEKLLIRKESVRSKQKQLVLAGATILCTAFCLLSDVAGDHFLAGRRKAVIAEMSAWQNRDGQPSTATAHEDNPVLRRQLELRIYRPDTHILLESMRLGVYEPPRQATQPESGSQN